MPPLSAFLSLSLSLSLSLCTDNKAAYIEPLCGVQLCIADLFSKSPRLASGS